MLGPENEEMKHLNCVDIFRFLLLLNEVERESFLAVSNWSMLTSCTSPKHQPKPARGKADWHQLRKKQLETRFCSGVGLF